MKPTTRSETRALLAKHWWRDCIVCIVGMNVGAIALFYGMTELFL